MTMFLQITPSITGMSIDVAIFSCLLLMALYHFTLFLFRGSERVTLSFASICFFWAAWCMSTPMYETNATVLGMIFPSIGPMVQSKLSALSADWATWSILFYLSALAPLEFSPGLTRVLLWYTVIHSLAVILAPPALGGVLDAVLHVAVLFVAGYGVYGCISGLRRKRSGFWIVSIGCFILAAAAVHDVLVGAGVLGGYFLSPIGVLLYCFCQATVLAHKLQHAFVDLSERLSLEQTLEKQRRREAAALLQAERERLARLRYQLNPHFFFNTLTAVRGAIVVDSRKARELVLDLANLCRSALTFGANDLIAIRDELAAIKLYLRIEQTRLGDRLVTQVFGQEEVMAAQIPTLLLQSLVENAIKHGKKRSGERLDVKIDVTRENESEIRLRVSNTGRWIEPTAPDPGKQSGGFGLTILKERLERLYPGRFKFAIQETEDLVTVDITIPFQAQIPE